MIDFKGEAPANADFSLIMPADVEDKEYVTEIYGLTLERTEELNEQARSYKPTNTIEAIQVFFHIAKTLAELAYLSYTVGYEDGVRDQMEGIVDD